MTSLLRTLIPIATLVFIAVSEVFGQTGRPSTPILVELVSAPTAGLGEKNCGSHVLLNQTEGTVSVFVKDFTALRANLETQGVVSSRLRPSNPSGRATFRFGAVSWGMNAASEPRLEIVSAGPPGVEVALHGVALEYIRDCQVLPSRRQ